MNNIKLISLLMFLSACQYTPTATNYQKSLGDWLGQSESALYENWGNPNFTYPVDGNTFIATYIESKNTPIDSDYQPYDENLVYSAMEVPSYGLPTPQGIYYCKTSFVIKNGIIVDYNFNGDDCVK